MEALICRGSNVVISCGAIRGEAGASGTQEKEKKAKLGDKARVGEKCAPSATATTGGGRSFSSSTLAPLPFPPQKSMIPAPLRFLWFSNSVKNEQQGSSSGGSGGTRDGETKDDGEQTTVDGETESVFVLTGEDVVQEEKDEPGGEGQMPEREEDVTPMRLNDAETDIDAINVGSAADIDRFENTNAAKRWIHNLLNVNFLKKSPRIDVKIPLQEPEVADDSAESSNHDVPVTENSVICESTVAAGNGNASSGSKSTVPRCIGCEAELGNGCVIDPAANPLSTLEVAHLNVTHDLESFSKFLYQVPLSELKLIHQTAHLSNLAYVIPRIQARELAKIHRLVFVTSSVEIKAKALAEEKVSAPKGEAEGNDVQSESKQEFYLSPASAFALAAAATSFLKLERKKSRQESQNSLGDASNEIENGKSSDTTPQEDQAGPDAEILKSLSAEAELEPVKCDVSGSDGQEVPDMASFMRPVTSVVSAEKETKQAMAKNLRSLHNGPCDWFAVDEKGGPVRIFSIQGSESFASWQANLLFEPIQFESLELGVTVHRGIYEAAKGLYDQVLPYVLEHLNTFGERARIRFVGHSLGGSLGMLLSLMLLVRGVLKTSNLLPVITFGSPFIMCGGDYLLKKLGLPLDHVQSIVMHRDIVPRSFACDYPDHVAEILRRVNGTFRDHSCLVRQKLLYPPMGHMLILQPDQGQASYHPLLPSGSGLYLVRHRSHNENSEGEGSLLSRAVEVRAAQRSFLNQPHPLEILSDMGAFGPGGAISKHHDPRSYATAIESVLRLESRRWRRIEREQRRQLYWPLILAESSKVILSGAKSEMIAEQGISKGVNTTKDGDAADLISQNVNHPEFFSSYGLGLMRR